ncbi:hypothetical protein ADEAN_000332400 [Angomonas deanei]|uniref:Uncharacterized protein n=1 Tax=Angomonas deanei TaxID=59799 RepID=A0A7G2C7Z3_9TRYP|nr:hypothetical protein ADEAN_000332400 [Angomonas deanei]
MTLVKRILNVIFPVRDDSDTIRRLLDRPDQHGRVVYYSDKGFTVVPHGKRDQKIPRRSDNYLRQVLDTVKAMLSFVIPKRVDRPLLEV